MIAGRDGDVKRTMARQPLVSGTARCLARTQLKQPGFVMHVQQQRGARGAISDADSKLQMVAG